PAAESSQELAGVAGAPNRLRRQRLHGRQRILDAMVQFTQQKALALISQTPFGDIIIDTENEAGPAILITLDDTTYRGQPSRRIEPLETELASILVLTADRVEETQFGFLDVAAVHGAKHVARRQPGRARQVQHLGQPDIAIDNIGP